MYDVLMCHFTIEIEYIWYYVYSISLSKKENPFSSMCWWCHYRLFSSYECIPFIKHFLFIFSWKTIQNVCIRVIAPQKTYSIEKGFRIDDTNSDGGNHIRIVILVEMTSRRKLSVFFFFIFDRKLLVMVQVNENWNCLIVQIFENVTQLTVKWKLNLIRYLYT